MQQITTQNDRAFRQVAGKIGVAMILYLVLFNLLSFVVALAGVFLEAAMAAKTLYVVLEILYMFVYLLAFLIPAWMLRGLLKSAKTYQPMQLRWHVPSVAPLMILGAIALNFAAAYMNTYLVTLMLPAQNFDLSMLAESADEAYEIVLLFASTAIVPAICEEILFRGVILSNLLPYGRTTAILGSAFLFGLMHGNSLQFLYTTLMGVILGYICVRTKSIWSCVLIHFFNNAFGVLQEVLINCLDYDTALRWNGILEFAILILGCFAIVSLVLLHLNRKKPEDHGSFGRVFEPELDYERYPLTQSRKLRQFFSPSMVVFTVLSGVTMLITALTLLMAGAM